MYVSKIYFLSLLTGVVRASTKKIMDEYFKYEINNCNVRIFFCLIISKFILLNVEITKWAENCCIDREIIDWKAGQNLKKHS